MNQSTIYQAILPQIRALIASDPDLPVAALGNVCAVLKEQFDWLWVGFYMVNAAGDELQLSAFQGPVACTRIAKGRGVCGQSWAHNQTLIVPDVHAHDDHIACSSLSQSEIVVPIRAKTGEVVGVLDVDSAALNTFNETDAHYLQAICALLTEYLDFSPFQAA